MLVSLWCRAVDKADYSSAFERTLIYSSFIVSYRIINNNCVSMLGADSARRVIRRRFSHLKAAADLSPQASRSVRACVRSPDCCDGAALVRRQVHSRPLIDRTLPADDITDCLLTAPRRLSPDMQQYKLRTHSPASIYPESFHLA